MTFQLSPSELQLIVTKAGSWKRTGEILGLTSKELRQLRSEFPEVQLCRLESWDKGRFCNELIRLKTLQIFSIVHGCQLSEIRNRAKMLDVDLKALIQPVGMTSGIGRKGELFFKEKMKELIREDTFETLGHTAPYDFVCVQPLGLVNVKTSNRDRYTAKCRADNPNFWDFSTKGAKNCDTLALVPLDPKEDPMMIILVSTYFLKDENTHIVLTGKDLQITSPSKREWMIPGSYLLLKSFFETEKSE